MDKVLKEEAVRRIEVDLKPHLRTAKSGSRGKPIRFATHKSHLVGGEFFVGLLPMNSDDSAENSFPVIDLLGCFGIVKSLYINQSLCERNHEGGRSWIP